MTDKFVQYFSRMTPLTPAECQAIAESAAKGIKTFKKGTFLLREGQISVDTYFILEGCIREYLLNDGEEKTTNFFTEEQWVISLNNFGPQTPALHYLVCVEDTTVVVGNEQAAQEMFRDFPRFETISRAVMENYFNEQRKILTSYLTDSPEQRYLKLFNTRPDLLQRIPQYQLASYIGVKPESLSRIRKRIFQKLLLIVIFAIGALFNGCQAQNPPEAMQLMYSIPLPHVSGRIDHLSFDSQHQLVFVAALGNNSVEVVDLKNKKVIHTIKNLGEPQGIFFIPERNFIFIANGDNGACDVFDATTFQKINTIKIPGDADNVRYDAMDKRIYVGYGDGGIAIIDATTFQLMTQIKLSGHPESFQIDQAAKKMYVNIPDARQIEIIDLETNRVTGKWPMNEAASNFPMCLDTAHHRLLIGCRHAPKLIVIDTQTGKTVAAIDIDADVDDIFYNQIAKEIYLSCGGGYLDIFKQTDADTYQAAGKIATRAGARTSLYIPELDEIIVAAPSTLSNDAALFIYHVK